jgi:UDP-2,3-diacylglucosamine pyrophosphatase LpxH
LRLSSGTEVEDEFKNNKTLFVKILSHYYEKGYTLVLNGDMEEGWGYQRDNIPLILDDHREEVEVEKGFLKDHRYYRIYGNHDDFYRGRSFVFDDGSSTRVYPAVLSRTPAAAVRFPFWSPHGCQVHGLHDAGDDVAAWGVSAKYLWLLETGKKNVRTDRQAARGLEKEKARYDKHEEYVLKWTFGDPLRKPCTILIGGHTHRPIFESQFDPKWVSIVLRDCESGAKKAASGPFEGESAEPEAGAAAPKRATTPYEKRMIETLRAMGAAPAVPLQVEPKKKGAPPLEPTYFNAGCGFFNEIACLEFADGHIRLFYIKLDESGELSFDPKGDISLEKYL